MKKYIELGMGFLLLMAVLVVNVCYQAGMYGMPVKAKEKKEKSENQTYHGTKVVIDPGHGGFDPGYDQSKMGIGNALEKDINLAISMKLKKQLEDEGFQVIMTRETDTDLGNGRGRDRKISDMRNRVEAINQAQAELCICVHQNSYQTSDVKGAQVFYHSESEDGKILAQMIQQEIRQNLDTGNTRQEKEDKNYYILRKTNCPTVIVECGFLSNWEEANKLKDEYYQEQLANTLVQAIKKYIIRE